MTPEELQAVRARYGFTQQALADALGVRQHTVARWETGDRAMPPYLRITVYTLGYRRIIMRNQAIIDKYYRKSWDEYDAILDAVGTRGQWPALKMFNDRGQLIAWWFDCGEYDAIGETDGGRVDLGTWAAYAIPKGATPKPELRLPAWEELGYARAPY